MKIVVSTYDHPDAVALIAEVQQEYVVRYGNPDHTPVDPAEFAPPRGLFLVAYVDGTPAACGGWRTRDTNAELKRMYVSPAFRRQGLARAVLAELERTASAAGYRRVILETGSKQPEALALYLSSGYEPVARFGHYADAPGAKHLGKVVECPSTP
jgi:GNAT superfamily N-acetyltransferase